ncbi:hypothetical protein SAMN02983003_0648 [Devosia enhydra]|uniref:Uncharacterized protein n=1 Tax=Devosia enhydra TaxID=665118 RepID=A0A1K2HTW4_9HYPH|nr:hypothetical protein [Devosia enhydra]SFZ81711.1 hypothetical protein SAMN02983003_0648 [Devosia enhydra]
MAQFWHTPDLHDIELQKHWELDGVERGVRKVRDELDSQRVADSELGSQLQQRAVPLLIQRIKAAQKEAADGLAAGERGRPAPWWFLILTFKAETLAVITVKKCMSFMPRDFTFNPALTGLASDINASLRDQIDFEEWRGTDKETVDRFFKNYDMNARNLKRLREKMGRKREERWTRDDGISFGVRLLMLLSEAVPEWFQIEDARLRGGRFEKQFVFTEAAKEALFRIGQQCELSRPSLLPTIIPPADWKVAA